MRGFILEANPKRTRVVIVSMLDCHFIDPDLRVEIFFGKEGAQENGSFDFEIGDIGTFVHLYWRLKKISCRACLLNYYFLVAKNSF